MDARFWGVTEEEGSRPFPCDRHLPGAADAWVRAIDIEAPAPVVFRWLCQLRAAPYSYDLLDNFGRRSPRELTPGLERLELGQRFMTIFRLAEFEPDRHITLVTRPGAVTYVVEPRGTGRSRLLVKVLMRRAWPLMPWLDLLMMRKQLETLKSLAEPLPHVDEHAVEVAAAPEVTWRALVAEAPRTGFPRVRADEPAELALSGRHPFSRYALTFRIDDLGGGRSRLRAVTDAVFPGLAGSVYRALVIGSGAHARVVPRMLRRIRDRAERDARSVS